jgi:hypothetical protein
VKSKIHQLFTDFKKRDEVTGDWRILHNGELHKLYSSPSTIRMIKSRRMRCAGHVARMEAKRNAYGNFVGKLDGKRLLGRHRRRREHNIKLYLSEIGRGGMEWIYLAYDWDE